MNSKILGAVISAGMLLIAAGTAGAEGARHRHEDAAGAAYAMTNAPDGNKVVVFDRDDDGLLTKAGSVATGGTGSGGGFDPLGSQNSLVLSQDNHWLLAVNGGSNEITVFRVLPDGLKAVSRVDSGGTLPVSVAIDHDLVYVLNAGADPNVTGFTLSHKGRLTPLANSMRSLGAGAFAQVGFDPDGETLIVTDKAGSRILAYAVDDDGFLAASPVASASNGQTPFGFVFDKRGHLLVVEVGPNAVSSYRLRQDDSLHLISGSVPNGQQAACWIAADGRGDVFTANPGSGTVAAYQLSTRSGQVSLLDGAAATGNKPLDLSVAANGRFLYALDPGSGAVDMFRIKRDGSLINLGAVDGQLPVFAQGMAAR